MSDTALSVKAIGQSQAVTPLTGRYIENHSR